MQACFSVLHAYIVDIKENIIHVGNMNKWLLLFRLVSSVKVKRLVAEQ